MENILDEYSTKPLSKELYESIKWWESRRVYFNIVVGITGMIPIVFLWFSFQNFNFILLFMGIFIYAFFANLCYCFGWAIDILKSYYFKNPIYGKSRVTLLVIGVIFSIWITLFSTMNFLMIV